MQKNTILISLVFLLAGFAAAYLIFGFSKDQVSKSEMLDFAVDDNAIMPTNPFAVKEPADNGETRIVSLEAEIKVIKQQLQTLQLTMQEMSNLPVASSTVTGPAVTGPAVTNRSRFTSALSKRLYNLDNLIKGGIDPSMAEDIVRRKNSVQLKRLALQDRATREGYLNTQRYFDELEAINSADISLREELGDQRYDEYLYASKQNNRVRVASVMLGSVAEQAGIQRGDVVLSYDNKRMYSWQELKDATSGGQLGEYVAISIYRKGEIFSFSVPRGPLGIELGATRLTP